MEDTNDLHFESLMEEEEKIFYYSHNNRMRKATREEVEFMLEYCLRQSYDSTIDFVQSLFSFYKKNDKFLTERQLASLAKVFIQLGGEIEE